MNKDFKSFVDELSHMNWGVNGHKLLINPKFMSYLNGLMPGPDRGLLVSLFSMVHYLSDVIDKSEPKKMRSSQYQPAIRIGKPVNKHKGKISVQGFKEFIRVLGKKYPHLHGTRDYDSLKALADMYDNPNGQKPVWYKLDHTAVPVGDCIVDLNKHNKVIKTIRSFAYMNHYQVTFQMNTGEIGAGCLDLPSEPKIAKKGE